LQTVTRDSLLTSASQNLERAGEWFLHSGIQEPGGGVARYHLVAEGRNLPVSTEITGYAASTYAYLYLSTGDIVYRQAGERTADFLLREAWNAQLQTFPFECSAGSPGYFFDCGIIIRGLLAVGRITGRQDYAEAAALCGESMARDFLTPDAIHPIISLPDRRPRPYEKRWSREPGCFQLKSALAWRDLAQVTGNQRFQEYWQQALGIALRQHDHFLPGTEQMGAVMDRLHAYCYFLEALLAETHRRECREALLTGIGRVSRYLREIRTRFVRSDVCAQLLRVRLHADALGMVPIDRAEAKEEASALPGFQYEEGGKRLEGGYSFGRRPDGLLPFANPVSTGFCLQAREQWRLHQAGEFQPRLESLI